MPRFLARWSESMRRLSKYHWWFQVSFEKPFNVLAWVDCLTWRIVDRLSGAFYWVTSVVLNLEYRIYFHLDFEITEQKKSHRPINNTYVYNNTIHDYLCIIQQQQNTYTTYPWTLTLPKTITTTSLSPTRKIKHSFIMSLESLIIPQMEFLKCFIGSVRRSCSPMLHT